MIGLILQPFSEFKKINITLFKKCNFFNNEAISINSTNIKGVHARMQNIGILPLNIYIGIYIYIYIGIYIYRYSTITSNEHGSKSKEKYR